jgi:hypothetical protein
MREVDQLLKYAQNRVSTTPVPLSLMLKAERRRHLIELGVTAIICSLIALAIGIGSWNTGNTKVSPWASAQMIAQNLEANQ